MSDVVTLGEVSWIEARIVDPTLAEFSSLPHVSAENILTLTGEMINVRTAFEDGMDSGKYQFDRGDVLYSKLRPYLRKATIVNFQGLCSADIYPIKTDQFRLAPAFLRALLVSDAFTEFANAASARSRMPKLNRKQLFAYEFKLPLIDTQNRIAAQLKAQLAEVEKASRVVETQLSETTKLADSIIFDSINRNKSEKHRLGVVLEEIKAGIGKNWADYPVLGATREGLAPAKEPPGKKPQRYKPAFPGTVFYNPMRILIGSIAFVDNDDAPGITSPDYVALRGKKEVVDSCWFYYWLRSPLGEQCINSLARGAVRERMLFNRLAEGEIDLPDYDIQKTTSRALNELKPMRRVIEQKLNELNLMPSKILAQAFEIN